MLGLTINKTPGLEAMVKAENEYDLNWQIYLIIGLNLGIAFSYSLTKLKKTMAKKVICKYSTYIYTFLADTNIMFL